jgi:YD repeat-containing protein
MNAIIATYKGLALGIIAALTQTLAETIRATQHFFDALGRKTNTVERCARIEGALTNSAAVHNRGWVSSETTAYPFGISDYSVHTDKRGLQTVAFSIPSPEAVTSARYVFASPEEQDPAIIETSTFFRNGRSVSTRYWNDQWSRETRFSQYAEDGTRSDFAVSEGSDFDGAVTNSVVQFDFLQRGIVQTTPLESVTNLYDGASSRIVRVLSSASPAVTPLYNDLGERIGATSAGVTALSQETYETVSNETWRVFSSLQIADGTTNRLGVSRSRRTGLSNALRRHEIVTDASGATTASTASFDPESGILTVISTTDEQTPVIRKRRYGRDVEISDATGTCYLKHDPYGREYMRRRDNKTLHGYPLDGRVFDDCGDLAISLVCEHDSATFLVKSFAYDSFGNLAEMQNEVGETVLNDHDALGNLLCQYGSAAHPVGFDYDTRGRMNALGTTREGDAWDVTSWIYDRATGLVGSKVHADDSFVSYTYTSDGKPLRTTWARGAWRENAYNANGFLTGVSYSDATPAVSLDYDAFQRLASASNGVATYAYANSALGVATNETAKVGGDVWTLTRRLDARHRLSGISLSPASQGGGAAPYSVAYGYDAEGRLAAVSNAAFAVSYAFSFLGQDAGYVLTCSNGVELSRTLSRNIRRHELVRRVTNATSTGWTNTLNYAYDDAGRVTARNADTFGYNTRSEVTNAILGAINYAYAYDHIGNHTASSVDFATTIYEANNLNQYTQVSVPSVPSVDNLIYDLDGNLLTNGVWSYTWDCENRLVTVSSNNVCVVSNAYDHANRRVLKWTPCHTTTFVYDGWLPIFEIIATASEVATNAYVWGKDLSGTMQGAGGVGGLLAVLVGETWCFPFYDNNGNIAAYVNEQGVIVAEYVYDAFGATIAASGSLCNTFRHRFSTKYFDAETGMYCGNDGVNGVDPWGEWTLQFGRGFAPQERMEITTIFESLSLQVAAALETSKYWHRTIVRLSDCCLVKKDMTSEIVLIRSILAQMHSDLVHAKPLRITKISSSKCDAQALFKELWFSGGLQSSLDHIQISDGKLSALRKGNKSGNYTFLKRTVFHELSHIAGLPDERTWKKGRDLYYEYAPHFEKISDSVDGKFMLVDGLTDYELNHRKGHCRSDHTILRKRPK